MSDNKIVEAPYSAPRAAVEPERKPMNVPRIRGEKGRTPLVMVTAYDATFARILDEAGADILLVGDSLGMVVQGNDNTLSVTVDDIVYHCRAVARGSRYAHIRGDLPSPSHQVTPAGAVRDAWGRRP